MSRNEAERSTALGGAHQQKKNSQVGLLDRLMSARLVLWLLGLLAIAMAIATIVPQNAQDAVYERAFGTVLGPLIARGTLRNIYGAWWFIGAFGLLAISLLACSVRRVGRLLWGTRDVAQVSRDAVLARPHRSEWRVDLGAETAVSALADGLQGRGYAVRRASTEETAAGGLTARRGLPAAWGTVLVHIGMVLVLLGAAYGRLPANSYRNIADLAPGESFAVRAGGDSFSVRLLEAGQERDDEGRPTRFWARAEIIEDGEVVKAGTIEPNRPLRHRGMNAVLQSLSPAGYTVEVSRGESVSHVPVVFTPDGGVAMLETVRELREPPWVVFVHDFRTAEDGSGGAAQVFADLSGHLSHNWERVGWVDAEGVTYSGVRFRLVSGGQAAQLLLDRDVGVPVVWLGFCVMVVGSIPLLGIRRRSLVAIVSAKGSASRILAGASDPVALEETARIVAALGSKAKSGRAATLVQHT